ncbi:acyl carrier protein [Inquilinus sp. NPDC058860]|uniref:acyl carrier protein n=1 Tax=Inquilinus sp. NPDC058860 TaxID=3346652 RepID=UPI00369E7173
MPDATSDVRRSTAAFSRHCWKDSKEDRMTDRSIEEVQQWLAARIAGILEISPASVDIDEHLINLGLTSRQAIALTADLETYLSRAVDPVLLWEHPSIRLLTQRLFGPPAADARDSGHG